MTCPRPRLILLTGAPDASSLQWETASLSMQLLPAFLDSDTGRETEAKAAEDQPPPAWRYIAMRCQHLPTGLSQIGFIRAEDYVDLASRNGEASFLSTSSLSVGSLAAITDDLVELASSTETDEEVLSQFYEHSFVAHENTTSSQIQSENVDQSVTDPSAATTSASILTSTCASDSFGSPISLVHDPTPVPPSRRISDLGEIPNSSYLRCIIPRRMTVNLVVGIISISAPRSITTRREGREMRLVEMLVGDETKAGFSINIWLPALQHDQERNQKGTHLEDVLGILRRQDVVLFRNVALNAFMGRVYGQSLRKDMTKLELLYRHGIGDSTGLEGYEGHAQAAKMKRVKQWVMIFVGSTARPKSATTVGDRFQRKRANKEQEYTLPPDTQ